MQLKLLVLIARDFKLLNEKPNIRQIYVWSLAKV